MTGTAFSRSLTKGLFQFGWALFLRAVVQPVTSSRRCDGYRPFVAAVWAQNFSLPPVIFIRKR
jgi:hypothetical protein